MIYKIITKTIFAAIILCAGYGMAQTNVTPDFNWYSNCANTPCNNYEISTAAQLGALAAIVNGTAGGWSNSHQDDFSGKTIKLMADIDLSNLNFTPGVSTGINCGPMEQIQCPPFTGWIPIGNSSTNSFKGTFDGNGKKITGLYIDNTGFQYVGLFGYIGSGGKVEKVGLENVSISASYSSSGVSVGGVAGVVNGGSVENCYVTGSVRSSVSSLYSGAPHVGGIVGGIYSSSEIKNCFATAKVGDYSNSNTSRVGGILGGVLGGTGGTVVSCVALNDSINGYGSANVGRVVGYNGNATLSGNFAFIGIATNSDASFYNYNTLTGKNGASKTSANLQTADGFPAALTSAPWTYVSGKLPGLGSTTIEMPAHLETPFTGTGTSKDPYLISSIEDLEKLAVEVNNGNYDYNSQNYKLMVDIDLSSKYGSGKLSWTPIGIASYLPFSGVFDGNGKKINNLYIYSSGNNNVGLFGYVGDGGSVENLGIVNGTVQVENSSFYYIGGVAGYVSAGRVSDCYVSGSISGGNHVGGVVGFVENGGSVTGSYSTATVSGYSNVGGVVGYVDGGSITTSYSTGVVTGYSYVGGIVGYVTGAGSVENCYTKGAVTAENESYSHVGGVVGRLNSGHVASCYALGAVSGISYVGGIVGSLDYLTYDWGYGTTSVLNCAALNESVSNSSSYGSSYVGRVIGGNTSGSTDRFYNIALLDLSSGNGAKFAGRYTFSSKDGYDVSADILKTAGKYPEVFGAFTSGSPLSPWTYETGKLPGLGGEAVVLPNHIANSEAKFVFNGFGIESHPFKINELEDLEKLADSVAIRWNRYSDKHYILEKNLNMTSKYGALHGKSWAPIGSKDDATAFSGVFNGNNKTITGLYIDNTANLQLAGLFGLVLTGAVKNLGMVNVDITAERGSTYDNIYVGGVAGYVTSGSVENCYVTGTVTGTSSNSYIGGVVGYVDTGVKNCYATCAVTGNSSNSNVGGVVGYVTGYNTMVENCYSTGAVSASYSDSYAGGVVGYVYNGTVRNCAALNPSVSGYSSGNIGRVVGYRYNLTQSGNIAFIGMTAGGANFSGDVRDGDDMIKDGLVSGVGLPAGFTSSPWTYEAGSLPGFGAVVAMPDYITASTAKFDFEGYGTEHSPFKINDLADLQKLASRVNAGNTSYNGKHYKLMADIINVGTWNSYIIGNSSSPFSGVFDGNEKKITGLNITSGSYVGLFGYVSGGTIKKLGVSGTVSGNSYVGGIVGQLDGGNVTTCYSTVTVSGSSQNVGGVVGYVSNNGNVENCYTTGAVGGNSYPSYVGGVVGYMSSGSVKSCYATGAVSGYNNVGGVVGYVGSSSSVTYCAALNPSVNSSYSYYVGRVVGDYYSSYSVTLSNNIAFSGMLPLGNAYFSDYYKDGEGKTTAQLRGAATFSPLSMTTDPWTHVEGALPWLFGGTVPLPLPDHMLDVFDGEGTADNPYQIKNLVDLKALADLVNVGDDYRSKYYKLMNDIDMSTTYGVGLLSWVPIGTYSSYSYDSYPFSGVFDGNNKKITGLYISSSSSYIGLFGYVSGTVKNLGVSGKVKGGSYVGGVAGSVGGNGRVENCSVTADTVSGSSQYIGGVVGYLGPGTESTVTGSYSTAVVSGSSGVGGVVGYVAANHGNIVTNCYATGAVIGGSQSQYVGGVVGYAGGDVTNCYATGAVTGSSYVGGVVGYLYYNDMTSCYAAGAVSGSSYVGGVVGYVSVSSYNYNNVTNCAALNPSVTGSGSSGVGRVIGYYDDYYSSLTIHTNVAFAGIGGGPFEGIKLGNTKQGVDKTVSELKTSAGFPESLTASPWTYTAGKLPGLGAVVDWPAHIKPAATVVINDNVNATPRVGDTLTAGLLYYGAAPTKWAWKFGGLPIGTADAPYIVSLDDIGGEITVEVTQDGATYAAKTKSVLKGRRPDAPSNKPKIEYVTFSSVKLEAIEGYEYAKSNIPTSNIYNIQNELKWQKSPVFNGLTSNNVYYFVQRVAETKYAYASERSNDTTARTLRPDQQQPRSRVDDVVSAVEPEAPVVAPREAERTAYVLPPVESAAAVPQLSFAGGFTAGPNPVSKQSGIINFYRQGKPASGELRVYDINGNIISNIKIADMPVDNNQKRQVGQWNLRDKNGRTVSEGTYVVKGVLKTSDGKTEKVSLIISVRH